MLNSPAFCWLESLPQAGSLEISDACNTFVSALHLASVWSSSNVGNTGVTRLGSTRNFSLILAGSPEGTSTKIFLDRYFLGFMNTSARPKGNAGMFVRVTGAPL